MRYYLGQCRNYSGCLGKWAIPYNSLFVQASLSKKIIADHQTIKSSEDPLCFGRVKFGINNSQNEYRKRLSLFWSLKRTWRFDKRYNNWHTWECLDWQPPKYLIKNKRKNGQGITPPPFYCFFCSLVRSAPCDRGPDP
jgi:hypothetical protein